MSDTIQSFSPGAPGAGDKASDFVDAISESAQKNRVFEEIPPPFPTATMPADKPIDHVEEERIQQAFDPKNFTSKYDRFDMADFEDRERLEKINDHVLHDGWVMAREEWNHTKEGSTYVIAKYLIAKTKPGKTE